MVVVYCIVDMQENGSELRRESPPPPPPPQEKLLTRVDSTFYWKFLTPFAYVTPPPNTGAQATITGMLWSGHGSGVAGAGGIHRFLANNQHYTERIQTILTGKCCTPGESTQLDERPCNLVTRANGYKRTHGHLTVGMRMWGIYRRGSTPTDVINS